MSANPTPRPHECRECGQAHYRCLGHRRSDGSPCGHQPSNGQDVCVKHGARAPQNHTKAVERIEEARALSLLEKLDKPEPIDHPVYELLEQAAELKQAKAFFRDRMAALEDVDLTYRDRQDVERERALIIVYGTFAERYSKLLVDMAKLDLKAKALALQQETATQVMQAVTQALTQTGLADHEPQVRQALAAILRTRTQPQTDRTGALGVASHEPGSHAGG